MGQNQQEIELDIIEPGLWVIISKLEIVSGQLQHNGVKTNELEKIIDSFNELEELEKWNELTNELNKLSSNVAKQILDLDIKEGYFLVTEWFTAINLANNLIPDGLIFQMLDLINDSTELEMLEDLKSLVIEQIKNQYMSLKNNYDWNSCQDQQIKKLIEILMEENEWDEIRIGTEHIIQLICLEKNFSLTDKMNALNITANISSLVNWIDFCLQKEINDDGE